MIHPILVTLALLTPARPVVSNVQAPADYVYTFRTTGDDHGTSGTVRVHGDRMRIDIDKSSGGGEYMIVTDGGERLFNVHPDRKTIEQIDAAKFENVIGMAMRGVSTVAKFSVQNASISSQRIGSGEMLLGRSTEHMRIRESYDVKITALGFDGGTEHTTVVTDYWDVPGLDIGHNPLFGLLENATTAMVQGDRDYVAKQHAARDAALRGAVLKTSSVTFTSKSGDAGKETRRTLELTSLTQAAQPAGMFELPKGYEMKSGGSFTI